MDIYSYTNTLTMDKDNIKNLIDKGYSLNKISKELNKSLTTIRYWVKKHGLKSNHVQFKYLEKAYGILKKFTENPRHAPVILKSPNLHFWNPLKWKLKTIFFLCLTMLRHTNNRFKCVKLN